MLPRGPEEPPERKRTRPSPVLVYLENSVADLEFSRYAPSMERKKQLDLVGSLLAHHRAVGLLGARQVGKTTLAHQLARRRKEPVTFFDLENPDDLARLDEPMLALESLRGIVVIDEIQRRPDLFPILRVLLDRPRAPRYLLLGSASPDLLRQSSETLAGRIVYHVLEGFTLEEVGARQLSRLWLRGG